MENTRARRRWRNGALVAVAMLGVLALGACTEGDSAGVSSSSAARAAEPAPPAVGSAGAASGLSAADSGTKGKAADSAAVVAAAEEERREITTAELTVRTRDVTAAAARVGRAAAGAKGYVSDEETSTEGGRTESVLTVRVPPSGLDRVMDEAAATGTTVSRSRSSQDVSGTYVDTASRVRSQTASVERVRALLSRATTIGQVVQVESELARREADLEALKARLQQLDQQTTLATLTVSLVPPSSPPPAQAGFGGGLKAGWHALGASAAVALAVLGAVLPFAVLLAVVGVPAVLLLRRRRRPVVDAVDAAAGTS
jgi:hypothetical protein